MQSDQVTIRPIRQAEIPLVFSSWIKPLRRLNELAHVEWNAKKLGEPPVANRLYCEGLHRKIGRILQFDQTKVFVAVLDDDITVAGYSVVTFRQHSLVPVLHWVSVKERLRKYGVARRLLAKCMIAPPLERPLVISFRTPCWRYFAKALNLEWTYNPYEGDL